MALMQPNTAAGIRAALAQHGVAQGPQKLLLKEQEAAEFAVSTGIYTVFRSESLERSASDFCTRIAPSVFLLHVAL